MYFCCCFVLTRIKPHICTNWLWSWGTSEKACDSQKALSESQPIMIWGVLSRMLFLYVYNRYTYLFCCNLLNTQAHTPVFCCLPLYNMVRDFLVFFKDLRSQSIPNRGISMFQNCWRYHLDRICKQIGYIISFNIYFLTTKRTYSKKF